MHPGSFFEKSWKPYFGSLSQSCAGVRSLCRSSAQFLLPLLSHVHLPRYYRYSICFSVLLLLTEGIGNAQLLIATTCDLCAHVLGASHSLTTSSLFAVALGSFYAGQLDAQGLGDALRCSREKLSRAIESLLIHREFDAAVASSQ